MEVKQCAFTSTFSHNVSEETRDFKRRLELEENSDYGRKEQVTKSPEVDGSMLKQAA